MRSGIVNFACSSLAPALVMANPNALPNWASAIATGLAPQINSSGPGKTGSTKMSILPWLGHMLRANSTPALAWPGPTPSSRRASSGCTEMRRGRPSRKAARAAANTAARAQPPPIQPADSEPSARISALAPALAAVRATVRTTVATANGSPAAFIAFSSSNRSSGCFMDRPSLKARQIRFEGGQGFEIMGRREQIDVGQRRLHALRDRRIALPPEHRVEPDDAPAAPLELPHFRGKGRRRARVVTIGDDHNAGARMNDARGMPAVEGSEAFADARAAAGTLRQQREPLKRAADVLFAQRRRDVGETRMEQEGVGLSEMVKHAVDEAHEHAGVQAHGARDIEQDHEPQRLWLPAAPHQVDRHTAVADVATHAAPQVEAGALCARALAPGEPPAHLAGEARRQGVGLGNGFRVGDLAEVRFGEMLGARGTLPAAEPILRPLQGARIVAGYQLADPRGACGWTLGPWQRTWRRRALRPRMRVHSDDAAPTTVPPIGIEDAVELLPVGTPGAK